MFHWPSSRSRAASESFVTRHHEEVAPNFACAATQPSHGRSASNLHCDYMSSPTEWRDFFLCNLIVRCLCCVREAKTLPPLMLMGNKSFFSSLKKALGTIDRCTIHTRAHAKRRRARMDMLHVNNGRGRIIFKYEGKKVFHYFHYNFSLSLHPTLPFPGRG